jgi:mycofactocin system glycosyltransferase
VIPLSYRLRDRVRLEDLGGGRWRAICDLPLSVVNVNAAAARLLTLTRGGVDVTALAAALSVGEEKVLKLCEYFRGKGLMDVTSAPPDPAVTPMVSVIVPTKDREAELDECLAALFALDYPRDRYEVIVVDDGSTDGTVAVAGRYPCHLLSNGRNRGQSYSRNAGARRASGEILAFLDSDCVADSGWLGDLAPFFAWSRVAAVGGYVAGYYSSSRLDRYEQVASSLNMGERLLLGADDPGTFYVPTCNLLVRRTAYDAVGGIREDLHVGEDVDLCWRLRARGDYLFYVPQGIVRHKHRNRLGAMARRRAEYGTSEATLHALHPEKRKRFGLTPLPAVTFAVVAVALIGRRPWFLVACLLPVLWDGSRRLLHLRREGVHVPSHWVWFAVLRGHLSTSYFLLFHVVRYYLLPLVVAGFVLPGLWVLAVFAVLYSSVVDYAVKRPRLWYPTFLCFYLAEHTAYQSGVLVGCLRSRSFRSYVPTFRRPRARLAPGGSSR